MKKAILVVSFGTSHLETCSRTISVIEEQIAAAFPDYLIRRSFTSGVIRRKLAEQSKINIDDVAQALERLLADGVDHVCVQPTHLLYGIEYERMVATVNSYRSKFVQVVFGQPLMSTQQDYEQVAQIVLDNTPTLGEQDGLVLMGHGTRHYVNSTYAALDYLFADRYSDHVFVGTVSFYPDRQAVLKKMVKAGGIKKVYLMPLMIVAGDHAVNDMAGDDPDSWKNTFLTAGYQVEIILHGLGELAEIQQMYVERVKQAINCS